MTADDGDHRDADECPVCGAPILAVEVRGPSRAERYAQPCGHRLPPGFEFEDSDDEEDSLATWQERLKAYAGDGGGCLETAQAAAHERSPSRRDLMTGALSTAAGLGVLGSLAGSLTVDSAGETIVGVTEDGEPVTLGDFEEWGVELGEQELNDDGELLAASPFLPTVRPTWYCNGSVSWHCIAAAVSGSSVVCRPCERAPTKATCKPCVAALIGSSYLGRSSCCSGRWERTF